MHADATTANLVVTNENGRGAIPSSLLPSLFDPFKRGLESFSRTRSVGLGLYIVDQLVRGHGGRVSVDSSNEAGTTTFSVALPRESSV